MKKLLTIFTVLLTLSSFAQNGYDWGTSKKEGESKYVFIQLNYKTDNYMSCRPRIQWLINEAPNVHKDLYVMGAEVYKKAAEKTSSPEEQVIFQDSALYMYQQQIKRFGLEADGLNYMGLIAYNYLAKRPNQWDTLGTIYNKLVAINDTNTFAGNIYTYLATNCVLKQLQKNSNEDLIGIYQKTLQLLKYQKKINASNPSMISYIDQTTTSCNSLFEKYFDADCESIEKIYDFDNLTLEQAKKAISILESNKCTDSDSYLKTLTSIYNETKTPESAKSLADYHYNKRNYAQSISLYKNLIDGQGPNEIKGESASVLMRYYKGSNKVQSRSYAKKSIALGYNASQANNLIGDLYFNSLDDCRNDKDVTKTRAIYLAAYNYYKVAGSTSKMAEAKAQFPSKEEMFLSGYEIGQSINTGCWINENVVLQSR